ESKLIMEPENMIQEMTLESVIQYLESLAQEVHHSANMKSKSNELQAENNQLLHRVTQLEKELYAKEKHLATVEEDYRTFIEIMERARKMTVLDGAHNDGAPAFKMDKNGNLEQVIQSHTN